jgi:DNA-binding transcriptional MerR regulator
MNIQKDNIKHYTIKEVSKLSGLPESTLRYYETIGLIDSINRDSSSKHRVYSEDDLNIVIAVACLNATGMSIEDIRAYLGNRSLGRDAAKEQIKILENQERHLENEAHYLKLRRQYVAIKIEYWKAVDSKDKKKIEDMKEKAKSIAKKLKLPKEK